MIGNNARRTGSSETMARISGITRRLIVGATLVNGILASGNINRAFVDMPAWRLTGVLAWAAFSRHADLGRTAMILYPLEAFGGLALSVAAAVFYRREGSAPREAAVPVYAGVLFTVGGLLATTQAAPQMLSVGHLGNEATALQRAFDQFEMWGGVRGICQVLAYLANMCALTVYLKEL
jgi:hypothetical protein